MTKIQPNPLVKQNKVGITYPQLMSFDRRLCFVFNTPTLPEFFNVIFYNANP
jgi:hypothetical protein